MKKQILTVSLVLLAVASCGRRSEEQVFVDRLMSRMTLEEKIGQMCQMAVHGGMVTGPGGEASDIDDLIKEGSVGSILSIRDPEEIMRYQRLAVDSSRLGIPIIFGYDIIHGCRIVFPENIGMASSWDMDAIRDYARVAASEAAAYGYPWTFSPMCDVAADSRWGRVSEGAGEDPYLGSRVAESMVAGYQGDDLSDPSTILACVKHFAAYGAAEAGREYNTVDMSEMMFRNLYLPPYKAAVDAGAGSMMSSFNDFDGIPASGNRWLLDDLLRGELGFRGFVVSDYSSIYEMVNHGVAEDDKQAAAMAMNAHLNMAMVLSGYREHGAELVREGLVSEKLVDRMCREILLQKYRLGLFEDPYRYGNGRWKTEMYLPENKEIARDVARKSMVLLKNDGGILPLSGTERLALIGPFADNGGEMLGAWSGFGEGDSTVTFLSGLRKRFPQARITSCEGSKALERIPGGVAQAVSLARGADVVLMALGLPNKCSGEAASLTSLDLPEPQRELFDAVAATGKPLVVLLVTGRGMTIADQAARAEALLVTWHPGTMAGPALADVLSGDYNPSGRLAISFPYEVGQLPMRYNHKSTGRAKTESNAGQKYISKYMFTSNDPLYGFGDGLSYTEFTYSGLEVLTPSVAVGDDVRLRVTLTNSGPRDGNEVAQVYVRDLVGSTTRPVMELKGFRKVFLKAGESASIDFTIKASDLEFFRADGKFAQESGDYKLWVGGSTRDLLESSFTVR